MKKFYQFTILGAFLLFTSSLFAQVSNDSILISSEKKLIFTHNSEILNIRQLESLLETNPAASKEFSIAKSNRDLGMVIGFAGGFMIGWPLGQAMSGQDPNWIMAGIGVGLFVVSIPLGSAFKKRTLHAVELYNSGLSKIKKEKMSFNIENTQSGIGLVIRF